MFGFRLGFTEDKYIGKRLVVNVKRIAALWLVEESTFR